MPARSDPLRSFWQVLLLCSAVLPGPAFVGDGVPMAGLYLVGETASMLIAAALANWISLRIHHGHRLWDAGLWWRRASAVNLGLGLAGGVVAACLVRFRRCWWWAARIERTLADPGSWSSAVLLTIVLAMGAAGEELFFSRLRISGVGQHARGLRYDSSGGRGVRPLHGGTRTPPGSASQYRRIWHSVRVCLLAQPRPVVAHRPAFRMELTLPLFA